MKPVVAVLGLGTMGGAFAVNLARAGFTVHGYNRGAARREALATEGVTTFDEPAAAVAGAGIVLMMLSDAAVTTSFLREVVGALEPGVTVVQMATIGVDGTTDVRRILEARTDAALFDAPVSGTRGPAVAGTVTVLASGAEGNARARLAPVFDVIGGRTIWCGEYGAGTRLKLVLNAWLVAVMNGIAEAAEIARSFGIDYREMIDALSGGPLGTPYAVAKLEKFAADDYSPDMSLRWAVKDADLALSAYHAVGGVALPGMEAIAQRWRALVDKGLGDEDLAIVHPALSNARRS